MKRVIVPLLMLCAACSSWTGPPSESRFARAAESWTGAPLDDMIAVWGPPRQYLDDAEIEDAGIAIWRSTLGDSFRCNINAWYDPDRVITRIDVTSYKCDEKYREYLDGLVRKR